MKPMRIAMILMAIVMIGAVIILFMSFVATSFVTNQVVQQLDNYVTSFPTPLVSPTIGVSATPRAGLPIPIYSTLQAGTLFAPPTPPPPILALSMPPNPTADLPNSVPLPQATKLAALTQTAQMMDVEFYTDNETVQALSFQYLTKDAIDNAPLTATAAARKKKP